MTNTIQELRGLLVYGASAAIVGTWLDYSFFPPQSHYPPVLYAAVAGTIILGLAGLLSLLNGRYGTISGIIGLCLSWPYFAFR
jgi:hypothetical protein